MFSYYEDNGEFHRVNVRSEDEEPTQPFKNNFSYTRELMPNCANFDTMYFKDKGDGYAFAVMEEDETIVGGFNSYDQLLDVGKLGKTAVAILFEESMLTIYRSTNEYNASKLKLCGRTCADLTS